MLHYIKLDKFFNNCAIEEIQGMIDIINGNHIISLRFLDWFVTRFCYLYKLSINVNNSYSKENNFNINISYKAQLKSFKKKYFDPFRRKKKFNYSFEKHNLTILTTLGQLNFFRWAINYDIIKYTELNYKEVINKIDHVNSYFKKSSIENTNSTSEETLDSNKSTDNLDNNNEKKYINKDVFIKTKNKSYKNPLVSRNIFLEF